MGGIVKINPVVVKESVELIKSVAKDLSKVGANDEEHEDLEKIIEENLIKDDIAPCESE